MVSLINCICNGRNLSCVPNNTDKGRTISESFHNIRSASLSKSTDHCLTANQQLFALFIFTAYSFNCHFFYLASGMDMNIFLNFF